MGRILYPDGKLCRCGCGQLAKKNITKDGRFKGWYKYAEGHEPPPPLCNPEIRAKCTQTQQENALPIFSKRIHPVKGKQYWMIKVPGKKKWVYEHRYIMEQKLGRTLTTNEHVHHKDNDGLNNDENNLVVMSNIEHRKLTNRENPIQLCLCICPHCGKKIKHFKKLH